MCVYSMIALKEGDLNNMINTGDATFKEDWTTFDTFAVGIPTKPTEWGYIGNWYCNTVLAKLIDNPHYVIFLTDYCENSILPKWEDAIECSDYATPKEVVKEDILIGKFIINHSKNEYIEMSDIYDDDRYSDDLLIVHPLAILCHSDEMPLWFGDFYDKEIYKMRCDWRGDCISISETKPDEFEKISTEFCFIERY